MSLDDISVRIGVRDVSSLLAAQEILKSVDALSNSLAGKMDAAARKATDASARMAAVQDMAQQMPAVFNAFDAAFKRVYASWDSLTALSTGSARAIQAELGAVIDGIQAATKSLETELVSLKGSTTIQEISSEMGKVVEQARSLAAMQAVIGEMGQKKGEETPAAAAPDVGQVVAQAVGDAFAPAMADLGKEIDRLVQASNAVAGGARDAMQALGAAIDRIVPKTQGVSQAIEVARLVIEEMERLFAEMEAGQEKQVLQQPRVAAPGKKTEEERALHEIYTLFLPDWPLFRDRVYGMMDKLDEVHKGTSGLGDKMDALKDAVKEMMAGYKARPGGGTTGAAPGAEDTKRIEEGDKKPARDKGGGTTRGRRGTGPKSRPRGGN